MSPHHPGIKRILRILTPESPGDTRVPTLGGETRETPVSGSGTEERPALPPPILLLSYACQGELEAGRNHFWRILSF